MKKTLIILFCLLCFTGCSLTTPPDVSKYHFNNLEKVDSFKYRQINNWQAIDSRSLIISVSDSKSYLLILDRRGLQDLEFSEQIRISSDAYKVRAHTDLIHVVGQYGRPKRIETIYKLPNRQAQQNVRAVILGEVVEATNTNIVI